jgi:hypothetical protein
VGVIKSRTIAGRFVNAQGGEMDFFVGSTIVLAVWAAIGPLVGVRYGNELSQRSTRRQWLADERTKEWRELLSTLTTSMTTIIRCRQGDRTVEMMKEDLLASVSAGEVLSNRLFIAKEVRRRQPLDSWREALKSFEMDGDPAAFGTKFGRDIQFQIEEGAREDIGRV